MSKQERNKGLNDESRKKLQEFLEPLEPGKVSSAGGDYRNRFLAETLEEEGTESILHIVKEDYPKGYVVVTETVNLLLRLGVKTKDDLLETNAEKLKEKYPRFKSGNLELFRLMRDIASSELKQKD